MSQSEAFEKTISTTSPTPTDTDIIRKLCDLKESLQIEKFTFSINLNRPEGGTAIGFAYTGAAAGAGLREILNAAKIYYSVVIRSGSGINENSEIQIEKEHESKMLNLMNKIKFVKIHGS